MKGQSLWPLAIYNDSGESIPGLSIAQIKPSPTPQSANSRDFFVVEQPDGTDPAGYVLTSIKSIGVGDNGHGVSPVQGGWVKYDGTAPVPGDEVGPVSGSWTVSSDGSGFLVWMVNSGQGRCWVERAGGGCTSKLVKPMQAKTAPCIVRCAVYSGALGSETLTGETIVGFARHIDTTTDVFWEAKPLCSRAGAEAGGGTSSVSVDAENPSGFIGPAEYEIAPWGCGTA